MEPRQLIRLYNLPISNFGAKVAIALRLKGLAHETVPPPGGYGSAAYKAVVPTGTIPAIVDGDLVLSESETIVEYLEEAYPTPPLLPAGARQRARVRQLARFHDTRAEPVLRALFPHMAPATRDAAVVQRQLALWTARLAELDALVRPAPWLSGAAVGMADLGYAPTFLMGRLMLEHLGQPFALPPALAEWAAMASRHPALAPVLEAQEVASRDWLAGKR